MELRHLKYFIAVAENLNISRAARQLLIAQPPLSRQIRDLESELGCELFERSPHGMSLTAEGSAFLPYAQQILELASRSKEHMTEMTHGLQGTIDIASVEGHAPRLLAGWIADFSAHHRHIQYSIWDGNTDDVIYRVANGLADFGILTTPYNTEGYEAVPVYQEPWTAMIPAEDPLAALPGDTIPLHLLKEKKLIIPSRRSRLDEIRNWFPDPETPLNIVCRVAHMLNAYELARNGVGIAIYPASDNHFSKDPEVVIKKITDPEVSVTYLLVWDKERRLSHAAQQFLHETLQALKP